MAQSADELSDDEERDEETERAENGEICLLLGTVLYVHAELAVHRARIVALSEEISSRENLIEQLQRNEQRMQAMRNSYETKLRELNDNIRLVEQTRDKALLERSALICCVA